MKINISELSFDEINHNKRITLQIKRKLSALVSSPVSYIFLITLIIGGAFYVIQPIIFTNDSGGYLAAAKFFLGEPDGHYQYWRTPLFPLLMMITGVAQGTSLDGLLILHFILALTIPILVYLSIVWINKRFAIVAALLVIVSLIPFINVAFVMPSQLYGFMIVVSVFFTLRFIAEEQTFYIYAIAVSSFITVMVRPQGSYLFIVLLGIVALTASRKWKHYGFALLIVIGLQYAYMAARPYFAGPIAPTPTILLSDLYNDKSSNEDQELYMHALMLIRQNAMGDARFLARFIKQPSLVRQIRLAAILQYLLNQDLNSAKQQALVESDVEARDHALFFIAWSTLAKGDLTEARFLRAQIGDKNLQSKLNEVKDRIPEIPVLTAEAPADRKLEPLHYVTGLDLSNTGGKMLLYPAFQLRNDLDPHALIVPENGPITTDLYHILNTYLSSEDVLEILYPSLAPLVVNSSDAARVLLTKMEHYEAHWMLWGIMDRLLGPEKADYMLKKVYFEFAKAHPTSLAKLYGMIMLQAFTGYHTSPVLLSALYSFQSSTVGFPFHPPVVINPVLDQEIASSQTFQETYVWLNTYYSKAFPSFLVTLMIVAGLGILVIRNRRLFLAWATCWLVAMHQIMVCTLTSGPLFAYVSFSYIFIIIAVVISLYAGLELLSKRKTLSNI